MDYAKLKKDLVTAFIEFEYVERFAVSIHEDIRKQAIEMYQNNLSARKHIDGIIDEMIKIFKKHSRPSRGEMPIESAHGEPLQHESVRNEFGKVRHPSGGYYKYITGLQYNQRMEQTGESSGKTK